MSDMIDRQAAIDAIQAHKNNVLGEREWDEGMAYGYAAAHRHLCDVIAELPSAQPELSTEDMRLFKKLRSYHNGSYAKVIDKLLAVAYAQPQRMMGRWIYGSPVTMKCDQCGYYIADWRQKESNFCPNCGARMEGGQDG